MNQKDVGYGLIVIGILLIVLMSAVKISLDRQGVFLCEAVEANPSLTMADCPAHQSSSSWLIMTGFALGILVLAAGIFLAKPQKLTKKPRDLNEDEKKIHAVLLQKEGGAYQSDIIKETGFSNVKTTRILDRMEQKGLIERKRRGMTNLVLLK